MSGHNRWSKIKHKKEASDSKKSKVWTKVIKEITVSARLGGGDINGNPRLRTAVDKARAANMPNDTIDRPSRRAPATSRASATRSSTTRSSARAAPRSWSRS